MLLLDTINVNNDSDSDDSDDEQQPSSLQAQRLVPSGGRGDETERVSIESIVKALLKSQRRDGSWTDAAWQQAMADIGDRLTLRPNISATESVVEFFQSPLVQGTALAPLIAAALVNAKAFLGVA